MRKSKPHLMRLSRNPIVLLAVLCALASPIHGQVEAALDQAETWLLGQQRPDGSFVTVENMAPRDSALAVMALYDRDPAAQAMTRALIYLEGVPEANNYFRTLRILALAQGGRDYQPLLDSLLDFRNGGGMGAYWSYQSNLLDTALAIEALAEDELSHQLDIVGLLDFALLHQDPSGGWGLLPAGPTDIYFTGEMLQALRSLEQLSVAANVVSDAAGFLAARQQANGSFGTIVETAVAYRALLTAGFAPADLPFGSPVPYLLAQQQADGSWEGDTFVTAQVVRVLRGELPNLIVTELTATPQTVTPGTLVRISITVRNIGPVAADAGYVAVRLDTADGEELAETALPALAAGATTTIEVDVDTTDQTGDALDLVAVADSRDELAEIDETDNSATVRLTLQSGPDLALFPSDLSLDPAEPRPGEAFELLVQVRNLGQTAVASFDYRVSELIAGVPAELLASGSDGPIAAAGGRLLTIPLNLPKGEHSLEVEIDPENLVDEESDDNNLASLSFFVVDASQPDLALLDADLVLDPPQPAVGETVAVDLTLHNLGSRDATVALELHEDGPADGSALLEAWTLTVDAGDAVAISTSAVVSTGAYALTAVADPGQAIPELDESNNRVRRVFRDLPDLAIGYDNFEYLPAQPLDGDPVEVSVTVRNAGTAAAADVALEVFSGDPNAGGTSVFTHVFAAIPPAANRRTSFTWTAPAGLTTLVAEVDGNAVIPEFSETNNRAEREVAVPRASGPDLVVATIDPSGLSESAEALSVAGPVALEIANLGDADVSDPFLVRLFVDANGDGRLTSGESVLASTVVSDPIAAGGTLAATLTVDATLPFFHPLVWAEVDSGDVVAEQREDNNRATLYGDCATTPAAGTIEPQEEWFVPGIEVETAPIVVQLSDDNGDGAIDSRDTPDVVVHAVDAEGNVLLALSGLDGSELWSFRSTPANPLVMQLGQVAAADLDGDGVVEVLGLQRDGRMIALEHDGRLRWVSDPVEGVGNRSLGGPSVGDLDADGVPEIVIGRAVLSNTGELIALGTANRGRNYNYYGPLGTVLVPGATDYPHSLIADIDLDGINEIVAGDTLYRLVDGTLEVVWDQVVPDKLMVDGFSAVGNLDGDPEAEIVYVSSNHIQILNHDGTGVHGWRQIIPLLPLEMPTYWGGPPTIADLDGDGAAEILVAGATELVAYRSNLDAVLWRQPIGPDFGGISGVSAFDLDGDGDREVLFLDENIFYIFDGPTGELLYTRPNTSKTGTEFPVVADVDGDGRAEILLPSNTGFNGDTTTQGLHVLGHPSWQGTRPIWNQYSYHVTNVQLDGTVPVGEVPSWQAAAGSAANTFRVNQQLPPPVPYLPNLTVSLPRIGAGTPEGVPITLRIGNGGRDVVGPGVAVAIFSGDPTSSEPEAETVTARGLRPGEWHDLTLLWQANVEVGTPLVAVIDPQDAITECSEDDNEVGFVLVETLLADLSLPAAGLTASAVAAVGQLVAIDAQVTNLGTAIAPASILRLYLGDPDGSPVAAEVEVPAVGLDEIVAVELRWDTRGLLTGTYYLEARADADGTVDESDEANNGGLVAVELVPATAPDLSLDELRVEPASAVEGDAVRLTATVINRGIDLAGGFETALLVNGAEVARTSSPADLGAGVEREVAFDFDTLGRPGVLAVEVRLDPDGLIAESDEENNRANAELTIEPVSLGLAVTTDRISYAPNENVALELVADNAADATVRDLTVRIVDPYGLEIAGVASQPWELEPGTSVLNLIWNIGATPPGSYAIIAELAEEGVVRVRAVSGIGIAAEIAVDATLLADRQVYAPHQIALLNGAVTNTGANTVMNDVLARIAVRDAGNAELFSTTRTISSLSPGAVVPIAASWDVGATDPGNYSASLSVRDEVGRLVAYASAELVVESSAETGAGLVGELAVAPTQVGAGAPLVASWTVTNTGNADLANLGLRLDLVALASEAIVDFEDAYLDLAQQQTRLGSAVFPTRTLEVGTYLATLTALVPDGEVRLDRAAFTVGRGVSINDVEILEGDSGSQIAQFAVTLSSPSSEAITVDYQAADASAAAGADYQAVSGTVSFAPGEIAATIDVAVLGDLEVEIDELFLLTLGNPTAVLLGDAQGVGTILDEEGCASPNLLQNPGAEVADPATEVLGWTEVEGAWSRRFGDPVPLVGDAAFAVYGDGELTQDVDVSAFSESIDAAAQSFAFEAFLYSAAPSTEGRLIVEFRDLDNATVLDQFDSGAVTGNGAWQAVGGERTAPAGTRRIRVRLLAEAEALAAFDRIGLHSIGRTLLTVADVTVAEGDGGTTPAAFRLALSCAAVAPIDVDYVTAGGSATAGSDFVAASGTLVFAAGESEQILIVELVADETDEDDESFSVVLSQSADALLLDAVADATILDDDGAVAISIADTAVLEGDAGSSDALFEVHLSAVSGRVVRVDYATADATATSGDDYGTRTGTLSFQPGETSQTLSVPVSGDLLGEGDEIFLVRLSQPVNATLADGEGVATIRDDDEVGISIDDVIRLESDEGTADAVFTVRLSLLSAREITVAYATADIDALAGEDYVTSTGTLTFPPGSTARNLSVPIIGDTDQEPHERFVVVLSAPTHAALADPEGQGTIFDDDGILISIDDVTLVEGDGDPVEAVLVVSLNRPGAEEVRVDFTTVDDTALDPDDYLAASGTLSFAPGTTTVETPIAIIGDLVEERAERFAVELSNAVGGEILVDRAEATIHDDDGWYLNRLNGPGPQIIEDCIQLTSGNLQDAASAWRKQQIDLSQSFDRTFRVYLGDKDPGTSGMVFALQAQGSTARGGYGGLLGYAGILPSVGVEIDTHVHYDDTNIDDDHLAVDLNGSVKHNGHAPVYARDPDRNIEDGQEHELRVIWNAAAKTLDVHFENDERLIYENDVVASIFGGDPQVFYGFTASTYGTNPDLWNRQYFCETRVCYGDGETPVVSVGDTRVVEGDAGTVPASFPVTLSCPSDQVVTVEYATRDQSAVAGSDYLAASGTLTFQPGETSQTVLVDVLGDAQGEVTETFAVELSDPVNAGLRYAGGVGTIVSDDAIFLLQERILVESDINPFMRDGQSHNVLAVTLAEPILREVSVGLVTADGSAVAGLDYQATSTTLTFAPGEVAKFLRLNLVPDNLAESNENFFIEFTNMVHGTTPNDRVEMTIEDDDYACPATPNLLTNGSANATDWAVGAIPGWIDVGGNGWRVSGGGVDYPATLVTFQPPAWVEGELRQDVDISGFAAGIDRGEQFFRFEGFLIEDAIGNRGRIVVEFLDLSQQQILTWFDSTEQVPAGYWKQNWGRLAKIVQAPVGTRWIRVRLLSVDTAGQPGYLGYTQFDGFSVQALDMPFLAIGDATVTEGDAGTVAAPFDVTLSCVRDHGVSVHYFTADATASAPSDYQPAQGTLYFAPGTTEQSAGVEVVGDVTQEGTESFKVYLGSATEASIGDGEGIGTILDDEALVRITGEGVFEGHSGVTDLTFRVVLTRTSSLEVRVAYTTVDQEAVAGEDYLARSGTLVIPAGANSGEIVVPVVGDTEPEADECLLLRLTGAVNATIDWDEAQGCIANDDLLLSIGSSEVVEGTAGSTTAVFPVTLSAASTNTVTFEYETEDVTAVAGDDYAATSGTLTIKAGRTQVSIAVAIVADAVLESTESFLVRLKNPVHAHLGTSEANGLIVDDDDCQSANLLRNGGNEELPSVAGEVPYWTWVEGGTYEYLLLSPFEGKRHFFLGRSPRAELRQDVDVSDFAPWIDAGYQRFLFEGFVRSYADSDPDTAQLIVEYRDAANEQVLEVFSTPPITNVTPLWQSVSDLRTAPVGTRWIRVRMIGVRYGSSTLNGACFDGVALRSLGRPTLNAPPITAPEPDEGTRDAVLEVVLSCALEEEITVDYQTVAGTALVGDDYLSVAGALSFAPGELVQTIAVPIVGDLGYEDDERFTVELASSANAPLAHRVVPVTIRDEDQKRALAVADAVVVEGDAGEITEAVLVLRLSPPNGQPTQLNFNWGLGSAQPNVDATLPASTLITFAADESVKTVTIPIVGDDEVEGDEIVGLKFPFSVYENVVVTTPRVEVTIIDNDDDGSCAGPNLLVNGGFEGLPVDGTPRGWTTAEGSWWRDGGFSYSFDNSPYLKASDEPRSELYQDVDLGAYAAAIAGGTTFRFSGVLNSSWTEDVAQVIVEFRDAAGEVLDAYDTGPMVRTGVWVAVAGEHPAPAGTASARVRLIAERGLGATVNVRFDGLALRSLGVPVLWADDLAIAEGDLRGEARFHLRLSCAAPFAFSLPYTTVDETATAGADYAGTSGVAAFAAGDMLHEVVVPILDDSEIDPGETFVVAFDPGGLPGGGVVLARGEPRGHITDDDNVLLDLGICLDGSFSMGTSGFRLQLDGTALAVSDPAIFPHDGTVRLTVMEFSEGTTYEVPPTIIDAGTAEWVAEQVREIRYHNLDTWIHSCLDAAIPVLTLNPSRQRILDISTDGGSNYVLAMDARARALASGIDVINAIGIGDGTSFELLDALVHPQPPGGAEGFVAAVESVQEYAQGIGMKMQRETTPDLVVTKTDGVDLVEPGSANLYTIEITNVGAGVASHLTVTELLPPALQQVVYTPSEGTFDPATGLWSDLELGNGDSVVLEIAGVIDPAASGTLENTVTVMPAGGLDVDPSNNTATDTTALTPVARLPEIAATKAAELAVDTDGDGLVTPGDHLRYTVNVENLGTGTATGVVFSDLAPARTALVAESVTTTAGTVLGTDPVKVGIGELGPGAAVTITFEVAIDTPFPAGIGEVSNQGTVASDQLPVVLTDDPEVAGSEDPTVTLVTAAPRLVASKTDALAVDADGDGVPSPGDTVAYTVVVGNLGNTAAVGVGFLDEIPQHATLEAGSVTTTAGTVDTEVPAAVTVGELAVGAEVTITFRVLVVSPLPVDVTEVVNQGAVYAGGVGDVFTDDPDLGGDADPTVTAITAAPVLEVEKIDVLYDDADGDSQASPGDELLYQIKVTNSGNTAAVGVGLHDAIPAYTALVAGTVQSSQGTVIASDPVEVALGQIDPGVESAATVTFRVSIDQPFPPEVAEVANQATIEAAGLDPVLSDDPESEPPGDPTATAVYVTPEVSVGDVTVTEGAPEAIFTVSLGAASNRPVTVSYQSGDGTATAGLDYESATGALVFAPGETVATVTVALMDDVLDEPDETFVLSLTSAEGAILTDAEGLGTIVDDDEPPAVAIAGAEVVEGNTGSVDAVFAVTLAAASGFDIAVDYLTADGTAVAVEDYQATAGTVVIPAGSQAAAIVVPVLGDALDEDDETFAVQLTNATNAVLAVPVATGTIVDDDEAPAVGIGDVSVVEGDAGTIEAIFTIELTTPSDREVSVEYVTVAETAAAGDDYVTASGTLVFAAGTTAQTVAVEIVGDVILESDETFRVELSGAVEATIDDAVGMGTILDDEVCPGPNLLLNPGAEATAGLPGWTQAAGDWQRRSAPPDPPDGEAMFFAGASEQAELYQDVDVGAYGSRIAAGDQAFAFDGWLRTADEVPSDVARIVVEYRDAGNSVVLDQFDSGEILSTDWQQVTDVRAAPAGTGWIRVRLLATRFSGETNDAYFDALALRSLRAPVLAIDDVAVTEGDAGTSDAIFTASLSCAYEHAVDVSYQTADGTAVASDDYLVSTGGLSFPVGATAQTIAVPVVGDGTDEPQESFLVELFDLSSAGDFVLPAGTAGIGTIVDDDEAPELSVSSVTVDETESEAIFTVELSAATGFEVTVDYATADATASAGLDYESASGELSLPAGTTSGTVAVPILDDLLDEDDETFLLALANAEHAVLPATAGVGTIVDDDLPPSVEILDAVVTEGTGVDVSAVFTLELSGPSGREIQVGYATADVTAVAVDDYQPVAGVVVFPAGTTTQAVTVAVAGDVRDEDDEIFAVLLSNPVNVEVARGEAVGVIVDDDEPPVLSVSSVTVTEGPSVQAVFTVALSAQSGFDVTVGYTTADGTAAAGLDYDPASGELSFPAGTTSRTVAVAIANDSLDEENETFLLTLANAVHALLPAGSGVATIVDDDEPPEISVGDVTVTEGDTGPVDAVFIVSLSVASGREVRVDYTTSDGDATAGEDYRVAAGTVSFPVGESSRQVIVVIDGDVDAEGDETFLLQLSNPVAGILADAQGVGTILDDDVPVLSASKSDSLALDHDGDGVVSPGDTVGYEIVVENLGTGAATEVAFDDLIPEHTQVVAGSVTTTQGVIETENPIRVVLGELGVSESVEIRFAVVIDDPIAVGVRQISNQGTLSSNELPPVLTDDPALGGESDPTVTLVSAAPELVVEKIDLLVEDVAGDGLASTGDTLEYQVTVRNAGNTSLTWVAFSDLIPEHTTLVPGSVESSQGTVESEDPVQVTVGELAGGATATIRFRVVIDNPLAGQTEIVNQGTVSSVELADVLSDDPDLAGAADPTVTPCFGYNYGIEVDFAEGCSVELMPVSSGCGQCGGKVTALTLEYLGDIADAYVEVFQKKDNVLVFSGTVQPGETFTIVGADSKGTLSTEITIFVDGIENTKLHTSCSQPIGPGLVSGDFLVVAGSSRNGGPLCSRGGGGCGECDGKVTALALQYHGGLADAYVEVFQKKDNLVVFSGTVQPGETFLFVGADSDGTLSTEITIFVAGSEHTKLHTSCSKPIGPGVMSGDFLVVAGSSRHGGPLCPHGGDSDGTCSPSGAASLDFHNREVSWEITNTGTGTLTIDRITLTWPSENGNLKKVKLGKKTIYDDQLPPPTTTIDSGWKGGSKDREIKSEKTEELKFEFVEDAVPGSFVTDAP